MSPILPDYQLHLICSSNDELIPLTPAWLKQEFFKTINTIYVRDLTNVRPALILAGRTACSFLETGIIQYLSTFFFWKKIWHLLRDEP